VTDLTNEIGIKCHRRKFEINKTLWCANCKLKWPPTIKPKVITKPVTCNESAVINHRLEPRCPVAGWSAVQGKASISYRDATHESYTAQNLLAC